MDKHVSAGPSANGSLPESSVLLAFALTVILAGVNVVAVRFTVAELAPFWGATIRFAAAATIFAVIVLVQRSDFPRGRALAGLMVYGILNFGLSYALIYFAIREMTAGFTMIILALGPLLTFFFAVLHHLEPFRWRAFLGALLAVAGIAATVAGQAEGGAPLWAVLFMVGAAACFSEATVVLKLLPPVSPVTANAVGMATATILLAFLSLVSGERWALPQQAQTWTAVIYLILFGSVALFYLVVYVIQRWTATASSYVLVLAPLVTVPLGALLADEAITVELLLGAALVLAAVWIGALSGGNKKRLRMTAENR